MSNEQRISRGPSKSKEDSDLAYDTISGGEAPVDRHDVVLPGQGGRVSDETGIDAAGSPNNDGPGARPDQAHDENQAKNDGEVEEASTSAASSNGNSGSEEASSRSSSSHGDDGNNGTASLAGAGEEPGTPLSVEPAVGAAPASGSPVPQNAPVAQPTGGESADGEPAVDAGPVNLAPTDITATGLGVDENSSGGTVVATLSATDPDGGDSFTYTMVNDPSGFFQVVGDQIVVAPGAGIDYETVTSHDVSVQVTDSAGNTFTQTLTITVNDVDEFDVSAVTDTDGSANAISEDASAGDLTGIVVNAVDADGTDTVSYSVDDPRFTVDLDGTIRVAAGASFDTETEPNVTISVTATSSDGSTSQQNFNVNIADVDEYDVGAVSDSDGGANNVDENSSVGTVVGVTAVASDADATDTITYSLSDDAGGLFSIDANTGVVTVAGALDAEGAQSHNIEVTATSSDGSTSVQTFTIGVNDVDEFNISATTDNDGAADQVSESAAVGTAVGVTALASDADVTDTVTYSLSSNPGGFFAIDANTGVVTIANALDYESATDHTIQVTATSSDGSTSVETFTIDVLDVDEFDVGAISDTDASANAVDENSAVGTGVGITASATDADGSNSNVTYTLSDDAGGLFQIDANTGEVTVAGALDREAASSYDIEVTATSDDGSTSTQSYTVNINDVDEFDVSTPTDNDGTANTVAEDASVGTSVGVTALASDGDATNSGVTYSLSDDAGGLFTIDANTGEVTVAGALDHETATGHTIEVTATSADGSTSTENFTIGVTDVNESGVGSVSDSNAAGNNVDENSSVGTVVGVTAVATDADSSDTVTYSLSDDAGGLFSIDANTGVVTVAGALDAESAQSHNIEVTATSSDGTTSTQTFTVGVNDVDEFNISATTDNDGAADQVSESATVGTAVGVTALATDADVTDTVTYSLSSNPGGFFAIDANTGVVTVANALDYESATDHTIQVTATSADGSTSVETFTIDVLDADEFDVSAISDTDASANAVDENSAVGTGVGITASAADADGSNSNVTYSLSDDAGGLFAIDANTGEVTVAGSIDREAAASYDIEVTATSDDGSTSTQSYTVNVNDVDEFDVSTPVDANGGANTVAEDASVGTVVGVTASASDGDATNSGVTYSLSDDAGGLFTIDANTGEVTVAGALDYETATGHTIEVTATSADGSTSTENFTIGVTDANEGGVGAVSDSNATGNNVDENSTVGTVVGVTAVASDPDGTDTVTYSLSDDAGGLFSIDANTGVVTVAGALDAEGAQSHDIEVTATSSDGSSSVQTFTIGVNDVDEFNISATTDNDGAADQVSESASVGTAVGVTALATDADVTDTVTYSLSSNPGGFFAIDANTGVVTVANALDYESATDHTIQVTATSADGSTSVETFTIDVLDVDEFDVSAISDTDATANGVDENSAIGTGVGITASATDADGSNSNVTYSLSDDAGGLFAIDANTGEVTVAGAIDREAAASYDIEVTATSDDGSTSTQSYTVNVNDVDEFDVTTPTDNDGAANTVAEDASVGTSVGVTALASDGDATNNGVTYSLSDDAGGLFTIDANTGEVTVAGALDYETATGHTIEVTATSADGSTSTETFTIGVTDADEFDVSAISDTDASANAVDENSAVGTGVGITASATDADGSNSNVTYSLSDDAGGLFAIDANTGEVTVAGAIDREAAASYDIEVTATSDDGSTSTQSYTVNVNDVDEFDVGAITDTDGSANTVAENASVGATVGIDVTASDGDATNSNVTYSLSDDAGGMFQIDASTGEVTVAGSLDYETDTSHTIEVTATSADGSTSVQTFNIGVEDINEGPTDMTFTGNENLSADGGTVLELNTDGGTNDYASVSNVNDFPSSALTVEVQFTSSTMGSNGTPLFSYATSGNFNEFSLFADSSPDQLYVEIDGSVVGTGITSSSLMDGNEHTVSVSWDSATGALKVYVDGSVQFSGNAQQGDSLTTGGTIVLGQEQDSVGGGFSSSQIFDGTMSEVRIFDDVRTAQEIADNYDSQIADPAGEQGLVSNWQMNAGGSGIVDEAGNNDMIMSNGASLDGGSTILAGSVVADVSSVVDLDSGDTFTFALTDDASGVFQINSSTGEISLIAEHDASSTFSDTVDVQVTDAGGNTFTETVGINLGTTGDDSLTGTSNTDVMYGFDGADTLNGGAGDDILYGDEAGGGGGSPAPTGSNLITNGSFENYSNVTQDNGSYLYADTVNGWSVDSVYDDYQLYDAGTHSVSGTDGNVYMDMENDGNTEIWQDVSGLSNGTSYQLSFDTAQMSSYDGELEVYWGGELIDTIDVNSNTMTTHTYTVVGGAGNGSDRLLFDEDGSTDAGGTALDNVQLFELTSGGDADTLNGGDGNDTLVGGAGADVLDGGAGTDTVDYSNASEGVEVAFNTVDGSGIDGAHIGATAGGLTGDAEGDSFTSIEAFTGSDHADKVFGGSSDMSFSLGAGDDVFDTVTTGNTVDTIDAGAGNDQVWAGGGDDVINGGAGNDTLNGEAGSDMFTFQMGGGTDTIYGGAGGGWTDTISLQDASGGSNLGTYGVDWTVSLSSGTIDGQDANGLDLSDDADGVITLSDGATVNFFDIERIDF